MQRFGHLVHCVARCLRSWGLPVRLSNLCYGILPALLPAHELLSLVKRYYAEQSAITRPARPDTAREQAFLDPWESQVLESYAIKSGRMLVLGSGYGRESLRIAERGTWVVGVDADKVVWQASRARPSTPSRAVFVQADFTRPPFADASFDSILVSNSMYSSVPGRLLRQRWLRSLQALLRAQGFLIISFIPEWHRRFSLKTICTGLNRLLSKLPGANPLYQPGDEAFNGHFLHAFQSERELRRELVSVGAIIRELHWADSYAVVSFGVNRTSHEDEGCRPLVLSESAVGANR